MPSRFWKLIKGPWPKSGAGDAAALGRNQDSGSAGEARDELQGVASGAYDSSVISVPLFDLELSFHGRRSGETILSSPDAYSAVLDDEAPDGVPREDEGGEGGVGRGGRGGAPDVLGPRRSPSSTTATADTSRAPDVAGRLASGSEPEAGGDGARPGEEGWRARPASARSAAPPEAQSEAGARASRPPSSQDETSEVAASGKARHRRRRSDPPLDATAVEAAARVRALSQPTAEHEAVLLALTRRLAPDCREPPGEGRLSVSALRDALRREGYAVEVRRADATPRGGDDAACLQTSHHEFLLVVPGAPAPGGDGDAAAAGSPPRAPRVAVTEPTIVDALFHDQFAIAHPTRGYRAALEAAGSVFVGSPARLQGLVTLLCALVQKSFEDEGASLPPWRTRRATLGRWFDVSRPVAPPRPAGSLAHARAAARDAAPPGVRPRAQAPAPAPVEARAERERAIAQAEARDRALAGAEASASVAAVDAPPGAPPIQGARGGSTPASGASSVALFASPFDDVPAHPAPLPRPAPQGLPPRPSHRRESSSALGSDGSGGQHVGDRHRLPDRGLSNLRSSGGLGSRDPGSARMDSSPAPSEVSIGSDGRTGTRRSLLAEKLRLASSKGSWNALLPGINTVQRRGSSATTVSGRVVSDELAVDRAAEPRRRALGATP